MSPLKASANELKALWIQTFGDSEEYVDLLFRTYLNDALVLTYRDRESRLASMCIGLPSVARLSLSQFSSPITLKGRYLCGLATLPHLRGQGIMRKLIEDMETQAAARGESYLCLIPANDTLRRYYASMGYQSQQSAVDACYECCDSKIESTKVIKWPIGEDNAIFSAMIEKIANSKQSSEYFQIMHSREEIRSALCDLCAEHGWAEADDGGNSVWVKPTDTQTLHVSYFNVDSREKFIKILSSVAARTGIRHFTIRGNIYQKNIMSNFCKMREQAYGMIKWLDNSTVSNITSEGGLQSLCKEHPLAMPLMMDS